MATPFNVMLRTADGRSVLVRKVAQGDEPGLKAFSESLGPVSRELFRPHPYTDEVLAFRVKRAIDGDDRVYIALAEGAVVGYFFLWDIGQPVPLLGIGIADDWQNCKLGQRFMDILIADARDLGRDGVKLTTMQYNDRAFHVYQKMGFEYYGDVESVDGSGAPVFERAMFLPLKEDGVNASQLAAGQTVVRPDSSN